MVEAGEFLEWAEFSGNLYGTPRAAVERKLARQHVLLEIEGKGARQVKRVMPKACSIFVVPPPPELEMLERRLRGRGTENEAQIAKRLAVAREELAFRGEFDHEVINPDGKSHLAVQEVLAIISG
jgi:guanylate kinase